MEEIIRYLLAGGLSFGVSILLTPWVRLYALQKRLVARPKNERWSTRYVALFGGVAIFAATILSVLVWAPWSRSVLGYLLAASTIFIWGLLDDIYHFRPHTKILGQIIAACILIAFGIVVEIFPHPMVAIPLTIFWVVAITNAFNLLDNMDGLACGVAAISAISLVLCSSVLGNLGVALIAAALVGACLGFLPYNFSPARIFMGDAGSMFLGLTLAAVSIHGTWAHASNLLVVLIVPVLVLGVPIFDTAFVTIMRKAHGVPINQGGKDHTSHRVVFLGISEKKAVLLFYQLSAILGGVAFLVVRFGVHASALLTVAVLAGLVLFGIFLSQLPIYHKARVAETGQRRGGGGVLLNTFVMHKRRIAELLLDLTLIGVAYYTAHLLRFESGMGEAQVSFLMQTFPVILPIQLTCLFMMGLYRGFWRYAGLTEMVDIFKGVGLGTLLIAVGVFPWRASQGFSVSVLVIYSLLLFVLLSISRTALRLFGENVVDALQSGEKRAIIFGAGDAGEILLRELRKNRNLRYRPVGFIDDDLSKVGRRIHGVPILGSRHTLRHYVQQHGVDEVFVAIPSLDAGHLREIITLCEEAGVPYQEMSGLL
ncbi:MAG: hypothetical protein JW937_07335 [Candidatus Omnitrophica bacterium]|nr:hypothetical protein [Candidatus Omnitrophota bacterium]